MYEIYIDDRLLYYEGDEECALLDSQLTESLNDASELTLDVPPTNPEYAKIFARSSMLRVLKDGKEKFYGEVREVDTDMDNVKQVYAVGELAFLFDSIQPQAEYHDLSPRQMLETWLNLHNSQVEERKRFYIGIVTIHDTNDSLYRYTNHETTLDAIREKLIDKLGGYLRIRKSDGKRYLDYVTLADYGKRCDQPIKFGVNLLDYNENLSAKDLYTCVIPLGARLEESPIEALEAYTDIKSVNGGKDYLFSQEAVNRFGWNRCVVKWDDVHIPSNLKAKGEKWLQDNQFEQLTLALTAVDLSILGISIDSIAVGDTVQAIAAPFGMNRIFPVPSMTTYLQKPDDNKIVLGDKAIKSYSKQSGDSNKKLNTELGKVHETSQFLRSAIDNATQMMTGSKGGYKVSEFDTDRRWLRDLYMNAPDKDQATNVMQVNMNGIGFSRTGFQGPYLSAWTIDGTFLGEWIKAHSIQAEALSVEYITSVERQIEDAETGAKEWANTKITTSIQAMEDQINLMVKEERTYVNGIRDSLSGRIDVTSAAVTAEVTRAKAEEGKLSGSIKVAADSVTTEVTRAKKEEAALKSSITVNASSIESKVAKGDFASYLTQYYDNVLIQFNKDSKYVQITAGAISIYDNDITNSKKRSMFDERGNHFFRDGYEVGTIGTNNISGDTSKKGLEFDLEYNGAYMTWASMDMLGGSNYLMKWTYAKKAFGAYGADTLHAGCDIDMHWSEIRNVNLHEVSTDGISTWSGRIPFVTRMDSDGTSWSSYITVKNGLITSAPS